MKLSKLLSIAILTTLLIVPGVFHTSVQAASTDKHVTISQNKTKALTKLHYNKKTNTFSGKAKPNQQIYICSPAGKHFGEGTVQANKKGNFKIEWASTPKKIYLYPFNKKGFTDKKYTYNVIKK